MLTIKKSLIVGIVRDEITHRDFELRAATVKDAITAVEKAATAGYSTELALRVYKAAEQIIKVGDIPGEEIDGELLMTLADDDLEPIFDAQDELSKKRKGLSAPSSPSESLISSSADTASTIQA